MKLLPIILFIVGQVLFDNFAPVRSVGWAVFFNCTMYFTLAWITYNLSKLVKSANKIPYFTICIGFLINFVIMLTKLRFTYDEYLLSMSNIEANVLFASVLIGGFLLYIIRKWEL